MGLAFLLLKPVFVAHTRWMRWKASKKNRSTPLIELKFICFSEFFFPHLHRINTQIGRRRYCGELAIIDHRVDGTEPETKMLAIDRTTVFIGLHFQVPRLHWGSCLIMDWTLGRAFSYQLQVSLSYDRTDVHNRSELIRI